MPVGCPMPPLALSEDDVRELQSIGNSRSMPHALVQRAQIVLACGAGETNTAIAMRMGVTGMTVGIWRKRYREFGIEGLHDVLRPCCHRTYDDLKVAEVINRALHTFAKPSPKARSIAGSRHAAYNPIARRHSQARLIPSLSRRSGTSSASTALARLG